MKKLILLGLLALPLATIGQSSNVRGTLQPGSAAAFGSKIPADLNGPKTLLCLDTLRYPQAKEQILGTNTFYSGFTVWQADNESISQTFLNSGSITISAVEFYGARSTAGASSLTVNAAIYNVDASNVPTTLIGSGNITFTATTYGYRVATLSAPVTVTGNYAVVLKPTNPNGILALYINNELPGQPYDELLTRFYSDYNLYPNPGVWNTIPTLEGGLANYEPLIAPIVSYTINTNFNASATTVCQGTPITYTNTSTPAGVFTSRMSNYQAFRTYFGLATADSTFSYDMDNGSPIIWNGTTTYTHPAAGVYDVNLLALGGFWNSCIDDKTTVITVNPSTNATFAYASNTLCSGASNPTPTISSPGTFSASPAGLVFVDVATGEIDMVASADGTYSITYTTSGICSATSSQSFTITSAPDASFTYASSTFCNGSTNPLPVFGTGAGAGTFTSTTGLVITPGTGEINLATSTAGTYTVTNTIAASGSCPASSETFDVTINPQPTATLSGGGGICAGSGNTVDITATLTGTGPWSLVATNGTITVPIPNITSSPYTLSASEATAGTYTITSVTDAFCTNTGTGSATVTVNQLPVVNPITNQTICSGANTTALPFTSTTPGTTFAWTNSNPAIGLAATGNGNLPSFTAATGTATITVTPTANGCVGAPVTFTITVNAAPTVTYSAPATVCVYNSSFALTPGTPTGGTFSGTGVTGGNFNPSTAGVGTHTITYSVTESGCTGTATADIEVSACLSLEDILSNNGFSMYPNPASGNITFGFPAETGMVNLAIISTEGKTVYQNNFQTSTATIDLSTLARATYFVRVTIDGKTNTSKLILE